MGKFIKIDKFRVYEALGNYKIVHPMVEAFHRTRMEDPRVREMIVCSPAGSGKSFDSVHELIDCYLTPKTTHWVVGAEYSVAAKEFGYIVEMMVEKAGILGLPSAERCLNNPAAGDMYIRFPWGAEVWGKSATRPNTLKSEDVHSMIVCEAADISERIWTQRLDPRFRTTMGIAIIPTTPQMGADWIYRKYRAGMSGDYPEIRSFTWPVWANPDYNMEKFYQAERYYGKDDPIFREQYMGEWVFYTGRVHPEFSESVHVIDVNKNYPPEMTKTWQRLGAIDFGHTDPFVHLWAMVAPDGKIIFYREYYLAGQSTRVHASNIKMMEGNEKVSMRICDSSNPQIMIDLAYLGINCTPGIRDRAAKRERISDMLHVVNGEPSIYFDRSMVNTITEFMSCRWRERREAEGVKEATDGPDHALDAIGYLLLSRPAPVKPWHQKVPAMSFEGIMRRIRNEGAEKENVGHYHGKEINAG